MDHLVFLTGHLAEPALRRVLEGMGELPFSWEVRDLGVQVAALMTAEMIRRRIPAPLVTPGDAPRAATRLMLPGRAQGDLAMLAEHFGIEVERGPDDLKDLPQHFQRAARPIDLTQHATRIFAEIVDAPTISVEAILARAHRHRADGADVIDLGFLPATPFPHLEEAIAALQAEGFAVSVDSLDPAELERAGRAGADYLLSLNAATLHVADAVAATPVLVPERPGDLDSLDAAIEGMRRRGRPFLVDPVLDPVPFGLAASLARYHAVRQRHPDVEMLMGTGNLSELIEADTSGMHALLLGICAELRIGAVLTTEVSPHACRAIAEIDVARRLMHAAVRERMLPKGITPALATVHDRKPFPDSSDEIAAVAAGVRDGNFRIQVNGEGMHVYNRDGLRSGRGPYELWPRLGLENDASHAFYMGVELGRAELAWRLGKRFVQDEPLAWGVADRIEGQADTGQGHRLAGEALKKGAGGRRDEGEEGGDAA